ncbi:MAG: hypothetical protein JST43_08185 [Bacteroidetes bacterium]|nr:hypothetical protein [Bacteroidota bacterium]MBS1541567.1 hypothetical protein [Bacteroidota bacterium]
MCRLGCLSLLLFFTFRIFAQESVVSQTNPASIKWNQINTSHFRLLFPQGFDSQAQRMANTLETIREPEGKTIGAVPRKISIILQNQSSLSNAFVTLTPRRAEFYAMPSQNYNFVGNNDWLNMLATHEYRHMAQFQHARRGFNKVLGFVFGYNVLAGLSYAAAPQWFWEGDAVATETAFSQAGRGRIPNFDLVFRTNLQEGRTFNYHKQYLESYKNNIPNWYVLGYHMVSYLRKKTNDPFIWEKVTARAWNVPFIPFRFSSALKKETGMTVTRLYKNMAADLQKEWKAGQDTLKLTPFEKINQRTGKAYTDYLFPQELEDGSVLVQKSGIGDIPTLVAIKNGKEKNIFTQGFINDAAMLSATHSRMVWNEYRFDPRWLVRNYSVIVGYDIGVGKRQVLSSKSRYAAAAISPDGYKVATVETSLDYQTKLIVLDYFSGRILKTFDNPAQDFISMPRWTEDGNGIVALLTNKKGKAIVKFNLTAEPPVQLTDFSNENVGYPVPYQKYVLYNSPVSGIDNVYALDTESGNRFRITSSKYGCYNPMVAKDGKWIYYNEQGRDGMDVVRIPFDPSTWKQWTQTEMPTANFGHLVEQEGHPSVLNNVPQQTYDVKRYHRWKGIINPYSWGATVNTSLTTAFVGIASQDLLSTTMLSAGYAYDRTERTGTWQASMSYQGWYPIIDVTVSQADRNVNKGDIVIAKATGSKPNYNITQSTQNLTFRWKEQNVEAGIRLPLLTTYSKYYGNFTIGNAVGATHISNFLNSITNDGQRFVPFLTVNDTIRGFYYFPSYQSNGNLVYNHFSLSAVRLLKQSHRDINSKFGQELFLNVYNTPYGGDFSGSQFSVYGVTFFPGLFKHHSLWGYWGYQNSQVDQLFYYANSKGTSIIDPNTYQFRNQIPLPRGGLSIPRFQNFYSMSANYTMPVWYPDIALGPLLNIQRVRTNFFYDYGFGSTPNPLRPVSQGYSSTGIEVKLDVNVMRLLPQLDVGFRYSVGLTPATTLFEILVGSINF